MPADPAIFVRRIVRTYVLRRRVVTVIGSTGIAAVVAVAWLWAMTAVDRRLGVGRPARVVAFSMVVVVVAAILGPPIARLFHRRFDAVAAAGEIELLRPLLGGRLITVMSDRSGSPAMLARLWAETAGLLGRPTPPWRAAVVPWLVAAAALIYRPDRRVIARAVFPWRHDRRVTDTRLEIDPGPEAVVAGKPWVISCDVDPAPPGGPTLHTSVDGRTWSDWPMTRGGGRFGYTWPKLESDLVYTVTAGDATSEPAVIHCVRPPGIVELRVRCQFPAYLHRSSTDVRVPDLNLTVPAGTVVSVEVVATAPLARAAIALTKDRIESTGNRLTFTAAHDDRGELRLTGSNGQIAAPRPVTIRAVVDSPPAARIAVGVFDLAAGTADVIPIRYDAADDHSVDHVVIETKIDNHDFIPATTIPVGDVRASGTWAANLSKLRVVPGDQVAFRMTAVDWAGQTSRSEVAAVLVVEHPADPAVRRAIDDLAAAIEWLDRSPVDEAAARTCLDRASVRVDVDSARPIARQLLDGARALALVQEKQSLTPLNRRRGLKDRIIARLDTEAKSMGFESVDDLRLLATASGRFGPAARTPIDPPRPTAMVRPRAADMPGYDEQLRLYFDRLTGKKSGQ